MKETKIIKFGNKEYEVTFDHNVTRFPIYYINENFNTSLFELSKVTEKGQVYILEVFTNENEAYEALDKIYRDKENATK